LREIRAKWIDRDQSLAWAIVRRAFHRGTWDTSLLSSTLLLLDNGRLDFLICPPSGVAGVPVECWAWVAEHTEGSDCGTELYYLALSAAFESVGKETDAALAHNVIVATLQALLFRKHQGLIEPSVRRVLEAFNTLHQDHRMPVKERAAVQAVSYAYRRNILKNLTAADRLSVETWLRTHDELKKAPDSPAEGIDRSLFNGSETRLKSLLGDATWKRLSIAAREHLILGEFHYVMGSQGNGRSGVLKLAVTCYSSGLLEEIQEWLRRPLLKDRSLKGDLLGLFGREDRPEWQRILQFLHEAESTANTPLGKRLMAAGVRFQRMVSLKEPFEQLSKFRNRAAHTRHRIAKREAEDLHDLLFDKGLVRRIVECFPKSVTR
jgi:hypothetical protein